MARDVEKGQLRVRKAQAAVNFAQRSRQFDTTAKQRSDAQKSYQFAVDRLRKAQNDLQKAREKRKKKEEVKEEGKHDDITQRGKIRKNVVWCGVCNKLRAATPSGKCLKCMRDAKKARKKLKEGRIKLVELTPGEEAKKLGLKHKGWGKYADKTGKVVAKSEKGKLVKIKPTKEPKEKSKKKKEQRKVDAKTILAKKVGSQKGSNPGGFYKGADGQMRYVKFYRDPDQGKSEYLANNLYRDLGLGAPNSHLFDVKGKAGFASDIIDGKTLEDIEFKKGKVPEELANKILEGFAADILMGNWDAVGLDHDNIIVDKSGIPHRIDNGGTFTFRALAGKKPEQLLGKITEFRGFADPSINREYAEIFDAAGIDTPDDMARRFRQQVKRIVKLRNEYGNWKNYVKKKVSNWKDADKIVKMLEARTKLLINKAKTLE